MYYLSGIINALLVVGVLVAGVYVFQHKDELLSQLNLSGGGAGGGIPDTASAAPAAPDSSASSDSTPDASGAPSSAGDSSAKAPTYDESKEGKATTKPADKKTSDKTGSTKVKTTADHKCKKGEKYDSKKKKCVKVSKKKKSHFAYSYYVMPTYSFTNFAASPRISL